MSCVDEFLILTTEGRMKPIIKHYRHKEFVDVYIEGKAYRYKFERDIL